MHPAARAWVETYAPQAGRVLDIGGRDVNGNLRDLFPEAAYLCVDPRDGPWVDVVANVLDWNPWLRFDLVICCEVFEHTNQWREIIAKAFELCASGGMFICTAAGHARAEHSAEDGGPRRPDEWYENILGYDLANTLEQAGFTNVTVDDIDEDVRALAFKVAVQA